MRPAAHHLMFSAVLLLALLLRLPALGWLPSPAGDEGNWARYGLAISRGEPAELDPEAAFVSMLFAHLIAASIDLLGATFVATRIVNVVGLAAGMSLSYAGLAFLGSRRAGLAVALLLAVHPWAVMYTRTASVPYGLALAAMTAGPVWFAAGVLKKRPVIAGAGLVITSLAIHFSPLAAVAVVACGLLLLAPAHRWMWRRWATWAAAGIAAAHGLPVVLSALKVARAAPDLPLLEHFWPHLGRYVHMMGTALMGEATVRHFTNEALPAGPATLLLLPLIGLAAYGLRCARHGVLGGFAIGYFVTGLLVTPLILAPGREWYLPANHMDRYLFAVLPGFAMLAAEIAARAGRTPKVALALLMIWPVVCTGRIGYGLLHGGVDHGEGIVDGGGGYRGWLVSDSPRATLVQVRETVLAEGGPGQGAILYADRTFIPLGFVMDGTGIPVYDVRRTTLPPTRDGVYFILLWPDRVLSVDDPPTANPKYVAANRNLRERMNSAFGRVRLVRLLHGRDQSPLLEIWRAEEPPARLRLPGETTKGSEPR
jgi:hypothetical protein